MITNTYLWRMSDLLHTSWLCSVQSVSLKSGRRNAFPMAFTASFLQRMTLEKTTMLLMRVSFGKICMAAASTNQSRMSNLIYWHISITFTMCTIPASRTLSWAFKTMTPSLKTQSFRVQETRSTASVEIFGQSTSALRIPSRNLAITALIICYSIKTNYWRKFMVFQFTLLLR